MQDQPPVNLEKSNNNELLKLPKYKILAKIFKIIESFKPLNEPEKMPSQAKIPSVLKPDLNTSKHSSQVTNPTFKSTDKAVIEEKKQMDDN